MLQPSAPQKRSNGRYAPFLLLLLLVGLIIAYALYWRSASARFQLEVDRAIADLSDQSIALDFSDRKVGGFPFQLKTTLTAVRVAQAGAGLSWRARFPELVIVAQPWNASLVLYGGGTPEIEGEIDWPTRAETRRYPFTLAADGLRASFRRGNAGDQFSTQNAFQLNAVNLNAPKIFGKDVPLLAEKLALYLRFPPTGGGESGGLDAPIQAQLSLSAGNFGLAGSEGNQAPATRIDEANLALTLRGETRPRRTVSELIRWNEGGGTLDLDAATVSQDGKEAVLKGTFALDERLRPLGALDGKVTDVEWFQGLWQNISGADSSTSWRSEVTDRNVRSDGKTVASLSFQLQNGALLLGDTELFSVAPIAR
ncbi:MAG: DUF2125 domain-containing protein [Pseudomonadota bacterium]